MPIYETGHARNVQHFQEMISFIDSWGAAYAPTNSAISLANLNTKLGEASSAMTEVTNLNAQNKAKIAQRENVFSGLRKLVTRVVNFYQSTGTAQNKIDNAVSLQRKINGVRAETLEEPAEGEPPANNVSASQQSFTQLVQHFGLLIETLGNDSLYAPSETPLKLVTLNALKTNMETQNTAVIDSATLLSNQRGARDSAMYADQSGLVDLAKLVKNYVKAAFGPSSLQYGQIKGLSFTRPNK